MSGVQAVPRDGQATSSSATVSDAELDGALNDQIRLFARKTTVRRVMLDHRWASRYRTIRHWLVIVGFLNILCGVVDCMMLKPIYIERVLIGRVIISVAFWAASFALLRRRTPSAEGLIVVGASILLFTTPAIVSHGLPPQIVERYMINACFVVVSGIVFLRFDFVYVCAMAGCSVAILAVAIATSAIEPLAAKFQIIIFHFGALSAILNAQRIMTVYRCRGILLSMQNERQSIQLAELNERLSILASTDPLTKLPNRRAQEEHIGALSAEESVHVLMIDIDRFKQLNDTFGHAAGDRCLARVGEALRAMVRAQDFAARYGGEEFIVVLRRTGAAEAFAIAERLRQAVMDLTDLGEHRVTISIGIAAGLVEDYTKVQAAADVALYHAKENGRNRTEIGVAERAIDHLAA